MAAKQPLVSIITINYNQLAVTCQMLDSIAESTHSNYEIILVDNASKENPEHVISEKYPHVHFIRSEENLGFSGGNNLGIRASKGDYLFFVNNDTEFTPQLMEVLLAAFEENPKLGALSPKILYHPEVVNGQRDLIQYMGTTPVNSFTARNRTIGEMEKDEGQYPQLMPTAYIHGAAMMIPRKVIEKAGMMPAFFFLYYEELDWSERIRGAGYELYVEPRAEIFHKESISVGKMSTLKTYYLNRNRILFMRRNRSSWQVFVFSLFLIFLTIPKNWFTFLIKGQRDHAAAFLKAIRWNLTNPKFDQTEAPLEALKYTASSKTEI